MSRSDEAWEDVGEQFKKLGAMFRDHYEAQRSDELSEADELEVNEAVRSFSDNMRSAVSALIEALTDSELHGEARQTAGSFLEALGTTFGELGADLRSRPDEDAD